MAKKTQARKTAKQAPRDKTPHKTPEEIAQAFMHLWQEKWNETLSQKGWPTDAPMPQLGQMPFFNPFMPMNGFTTPGSDTDAVKKLEARVAALEKIINAPVAKKAASKKSAIAKKSAKTK